MKKFIITLVDNKEYELPVSTGNANMSIGKPLNHPENIGAALTIASRGFCIDTKAANPVIIAPSQIASVKLVNE